VAAYLRVSTDEQRESGLGLAAQRSRVLGMAAAKGWPEPEIYADEGISGTKEAKDRPALARLLGDAKGGRIQAVIVLSLDRLGRKTAIVLDLVEELTRHQVALISCKEALDTSTPQGQFVLTMFAALAQLERDLIAERTRAALAELGVTTGDKGGRTPYGYVRTEDGFTIEPAAVPLIRDIFRWREQGWTLRRIAAQLNEVSARPPRGGSRWYHTSVREVLLNEPAYRGGPIGESPFTWPVILDEVAA
jgi:DNA invertase Pin-like site-specific DNA recombinase